MHDSVKRLLDAAIDATRGKGASAVVDVASLWKTMGITPQRLDGWKNRGVSKEGAELAEQLFGVSGLYVRKGIGKAPARKPAVAHPATLKSLTVELQLLALREVKDMEDLPSEFRVAMPDDAMKPVAELGWEVEFRAATSAEPGQGVLVKDSKGDPYFRKYQQGDGDTFIAVPLNDAYRPMDSERHGLRIVAVMKFVRNPRL